MTHKGTVTFETERLILRRFVLDDVTDAYNNWLSDPDVAMYMQWDAHTDIKQTQKWVADYYVGNYDKNDFYRWAIAMKDDNRVIGSVGFHIEHEYDSVADISYALCKRFWNKGIMSEALTAVIAYAFNEIKINRLEAFHAIANPGSGRVLQKVGMKFEGHARQKYRNRLRGFEDCDMYAILSEDYFNKEQKASELKTLNIVTIKRCTELMFDNLRIAMDTSDWNADVCGAPAWRSTS
jgi:ribosomal-protein-alanine N-acetyltransferase